MLADLGRNSAAPPYEFRYWFGVELGFGVEEAGLAVVAGFGFADGVAVEIGRAHV